MNVQKTKVSIIVPTRNRSHLLPKLIENFTKQTWKNKELLILDDTPQGEQAIKQLQAKHPHLHIWHSEEPKSIGAKRNQLIKNASGELIAHFDDDDFYAPTFIEVMVSQLLRSNGNLIKLSGWFCYHQPSKTLGYWDTTRQDLAHTVFTGGESIKNYSRRFTSQEYQSFLTGYGFSYVYQRRICEKIKFQDINFGEDTRFYEEVKRQNWKTTFIQDTSGICFHIIHKNNTSRCFPNHIIPEPLAQKHIQILDEFQAYRPPKQAQRSQRTSNQKTIQFCTTKSDWKNTAPLVSICTLTYNRNHFLPLLQECIENQDYPHSKIEWLILDDSERDHKSLSLITETDIKIKYQRIKQKLNLGEKRNLSHLLCSGDYIVYMDDDDFYYPTRVSHAVSSLQQSDKQIAGSTLLQIYFCKDQQLWLSGPFGINHATAGTFAMTKQFARSHHYQNKDTCNEEKYFLRNYTIPMQQLDPFQTTICISHDTNTFDKNNMRARGESKLMKKIKFPPSWQISGAMKHIERLRK